MTTYTAITVTSAGDYSCGHAHRSPEAAWACRNARNACYVEERERVPANSPEAARRMAVDSAGEYMRRLDSA